MSLSDIMLIAMVSPKGGVGKTTVTAQLSAALAQAGHDVLAIDLDPQNALRLHLQMAFADSDGVAVQTLNQAPWSAAVKTVRSRLDVLPFGSLDEGAMTDFEALLASDPDWLRHGIESLSLTPQTFVLIDTPPGSAPVVRQALSEANAAVCVLLPEVSSLVTISTMERWLEAYCIGRSDFVLGAYLVNAVSTNPTALETEVINALQQRLGDKLLAPRVQRGDEVGEALATSRSLSDYAPSSASLQSFRALAQRLVTHV